MMILGCLFISLVFIPGCNTVRPPKQKLLQYEHGSAFQTADGALIIHLVNPLDCPLRLYVNSDDEAITQYFEDKYPILLLPKSDSIIRVSIAAGSRPDIRFASRLGDPGREIVYEKIALPLPENKPVSIIQGYNGAHSHNSDYSRYAIDFALQEKDTVYAAADGFVVGVVEGYKHGGPELQWKGFDNYVTLYHPSSGLFTQYAHLTHQGSLLRLGDRVRSGQPVGLAGMTGYTNIEHLHFNTLVPEHSERGLKSVPVEFVEGYKGGDLKKNDVVKRPTVKVWDR